MVLVPSSNVRKYSGVLLAISRYRICGDMRPFKSNQVIGQWGLFSKVVLWIWGHLPLSGLYEGREG